MTYGLAMTGFTPIVYILAAVCLGVGALCVTTGRKLKKKFSRNNSGK